MFLQHLMLLQDKHLQLIFIQDKVIVILFPYQENLLNKAKLQSLRIMLKLRTLLQPLMDQDSLNLASILLKVETIQINLII